MEKYSTEEILGIRKQFSSFCKSVIRNAAIDFIRMKDNKSEYAFISLHLLTEEDNSCLAVEDYYTFEYENVTIGGINVMLDFKNEYLSEAIKQLTERQQEVLLLSYVEQYSDSEIADILKLDRSTVSEHRRKALAKVKKYLLEK